MLYAHVVLSLPVEGPFDYSVPEEYRGVLPGCRVWVNFRGKKEIGYVVSLGRRTLFKTIKPLLGLADETPILGRDMLSLCRDLSEYYCCGWGEMLAASLPEQLRRGKQAPPLAPCEPIALPVPVPKPLLVHCAVRAARHEKYFELIRECLSGGNAALVLFPEIQSAETAAARMREVFPGATVACLLRNRPDELAQWESIRRGGVDIIIGTRSAVFAPSPNLGLIIVDEENNTAYKQDQAPHYHCRTAALARSRQRRCRLALGAQAPSLESMRMAREGDADYCFIPDASSPEIKVIDTRRLPYGTKAAMYLSRFLQDAVLKAVSTGQKVLVFMNRKGFATTAACPTCGKALTCPRCSTNLVYFFHNKSLTCNYCNFRMEPPRFCPACNAGYIKYSGGGTEKAESELARLFPQARIRLLDEQHPADEGPGIFISTQSVLNAPPTGGFDLTCCLSVDNTLNHVDFRSAEKAFYLLTALRSITKTMMVVQTRMPDHYVLAALESGGHEAFYRAELALRKQLGFPPVRHFCQVRCRGKSEEKVREAAEQLFSVLSQSPARGVTPLSVNPGIPLRLRGSYHWSILLSAARPQAASAFLKKSLKDFRRSGIIITVDMDPV